MPILRRSTRQPRREIRAQVFPFEEGHALSTASVTPQATAQAVATDGRVICRPKSLSILKQATAMPVTEVTPFACPNCGAQYKLVRVDVIFATRLSKIATWRAKMQHEIDWDDLRMLISVARAGSLAGAAGALGSHRSTVLRRIERLRFASF